MEFNSQKDISLFQHGRRDVIWKQSMERDHEPEACTTDLKAENPANYHGDFVNQYEHETKQRVGAT